MNKIEYLFTGTQIGEIHVFNVPSKGTNIVLKESLVGKENKYIIMYIKKA